MRDHDDDWGQVDGDYQSASVQFTAGNPGTPWLREGVPPWHMWGTTQTVEQGPIPPITGITGTSNTLARIFYKRPETWHWLFSARVLAAQTVGVGDSVTIIVFYDLIVGVGRSTVKIDAFQTLEFSYSGPPNDAPIGEHLYTTEAAGFLAFNRAGAVVTRTPQVITEITAENITCSARIEARMGGGVPITSPVVMELSAHFAPKNHIRPDWFLPGPGEAKYPGSEVGGK